MPDLTWLWRRPPAWLGRSLLLQVTGVLLVAYGVMAPLVLVAAVQAQDAASAASEARSERQVRSDVARLGLGLTEEDAGVRGYVATGDRAFLDGYQVGRREAAAALVGARTAAAGTGLAADVAVAGIAAEAWQAWAARLAGASAPPAPDPAVMSEGSRLLSGWRSAAARLDQRAAAAAGSDAARSSAARTLVLAGDLTGPLLGNGAIVLVAAVLLAAALRPVSRLAAVAAGLAAGGTAPVPLTDRPDEVGSLARALASWRQGEASRRAIVENSPVGLFTLGPDLAMADVNPALQVMFAVPPEGMHFSSLDVFVHPEERDAIHDLGLRLLSGGADHERVEARFIRADGGVFRGALTVAVVRGPDGAPVQYVCVIDDVTEHRERLERAARVQRELLPVTSPELEGYEVAGLCRPSREMSGDFYDWQLTGDGGLAMTLGDVSGRDMPAALLMAIVRIALRTAAARETAGRAVASVAAATARQLDRAGAFVTLFHGCLDPATGVLTYVDAGHGLALVVGPPGARRLGRTASLPLGVREEQGYEEAAVTLAPGEALLVFSDAVLEVHPELREGLERVGALVAGAESAAEIAGRLASGPDAAADDVTVLVLRRTA